MRRRRFLKLVVGSAAAGAIGCAGNVGDGSDSEPGADASAGAADGAPNHAGDGGAASDAAAVPCDAQTVLVYDTYAQALYLDGSLGPLTGVITGVAMRDGVTLEKQFWHGHGGVQHRFTVTPADFAALRRGERVYLQTTEVEDHMHTLFIDPGDPDYRVPDTEPVPVTLGEC